jgi:hypothetical protein
MFLDVTFSNRGGEVQYAGVFHCLVMVVFIKSTLQSVSGEVKSLRRNPAA